MNTSLLPRAMTLAVLLTSASGAVFAASANDASPAASPAMAVVSTVDNLGVSRATAPLSRAQVKAEARLAELSGQIPRGEAQLRGLDNGPASTLSRADVKAATRLAVAQHLIARGQASFGSDFVSTGSSVKRADVKAETRQAEQSGQIQRGESNLLER